MSIFYALYYTFGPKCLFLELYQSRPVPIGGASYFRLPFPITVQILWYIRNFKRLKSAYQLQDDLNSNSLNLISTIDVKNVDPKNKKRVFYFKK